MTATQPSPSLLSGVAEGREGAMEDCISEFGGFVWSIARRMIADTGEAEDLVQEVFAELWKSAHRFDPSVGAEKTFIAVITRRRAIDWLRKKSARPELVGVENEETFDSLGDAAHQSSAAFTSSELAHLVGALPEEARSLIEAHFHRGLTHDEISTETGLPLGTVKTRLRRGLIQLRELAHQKGVIS